MKDIDPAHGAVHEIYRICRSERNPEWYILVVKQEVYDLLMKDVEAIPEGFWSPVQVSENTKMRMYGVEVAVRNDIENLMMYITKETYNELLMNQQLTEMFGGVVLDKEDDIIFEKLINKLKKR